MTLSINKAHYPVTALGPGRRVGIWTQGCSIRCAGCVSRDTWEPDASRRISAPELVAWMDGLDAPDLDGLTISGGEPFDQPGPLLELLGAVRAWSTARYADFDVLCYSGYPLKMLQARHAPILDELDAVIAEPFNRRLPTDLIWRGSANQKLVPLSPLGSRKYVPFLEERPPRPPMQFVAGDGVAYIGVPRIGDMEILAERAAGRGLIQEEVSWQH